MRPRYRVAQWATGNIGLRSLRAVIEHPDLDLVGLYVYSVAKVGKDAGELCGLPLTGVVATSDLDDIVAQDPDCVLYMGDRADVPSICRLLESGANVVATRSEFHHPDSLDPQLRSQIEEACHRGNSSLYSTGSSPGFITEVLPLALLSLQRRLDHLLIEEFADMSSRPSPELIFDLMGFGRPPESFDPSGLAHHAGSSFSGSLRTLAEALGLPLDGFETGAQVATARRTTVVAAGTVEAGTIAAQKLQVSGMRGGVPLLTFSASWYLTSEVDPAWDLRQTGWHVVVRGDTPLELDIGFPVPEEEWASTSPGLTAHRPVNAVPFVCAAAPGIRTTIDLPWVTPNFG